MIRTKQILALLALASYLLWPAPARAEYPPKAGDFQLSGSVGYLSESSSAPTYQGADAGVGLTYSAHEMLALTTNLEHSFGFRASDGQRTLARLQGQLRVFPGRGTASNEHLFVSAGPAWEGGTNLGGSKFLNTQLTLVHSLGNAGLFAVYGHGFPWAGSEDINYFRGGLTVGTPLGR